MTRRDFFAAATGATAALAAFPAAAAARPSSVQDAIAAERWDADRRFKESSFGRIAYIERGWGPSTLFLHGFPLCSFQWRGVIDRLEGARHCIAPDLMGLGRTEVAPGQDVNPRAQVEMLARLLDDLKVDRVDLVGSDSGGAVAQLFLIQHPDRVRTLLLANCDTEPDSPPSALAPVLELARKGELADRWFKRWVENKALGRSAKGLGGLCYSDPSQPTDAALDQYLGPLVASPKRKALVDRYTLALEVNPLAGAEAELRRRNQPVRIVWGMGDTIFSPKGPDYLASVFPNVQNVRRIPEAKLFFPEEYPDVIAEEALKLWA